MARGSAPCRWPPRATSGGRLRVYNSATATVGTPVGVATRARGTLIGAAGREQRQRDARDPGWPSEPRGGGGLERVPVAGDTTFACAAPRRVAVPPRLAASRSRAPPTRLRLVLLAPTAAIRGSHVGERAGPADGVAAVFTRSQVLQRQGGVAERVVRSGGRESGHPAPQRRRARRVRPHCATPDEEKWARAAAGLAKEFERSTALGVGAVCFHPGAATDDNREAAVRRVGTAMARALAAVPEGDTRLLIENTAGAGTTVGRTPEEIAGMLGAFRG